MSWALASLALESGIPPWEFTGDDSEQMRAWWAEQMVGVLERRVEGREG